MAPTSLHPQAKFDPIPPDLDLHALVESTPNFEWAAHISASEIYKLGQQRFEKLVTIHVINGGKPLVIRDWNDRLSRSLFSTRWLEATYNKKEERVWDINNKTNVPMTLGHYLRSMKQLTDQWTPRNFRDERRQRLYLKDIDCPPEWHERLRRVLPRSAFYLNEDVEDNRGATAHRARARRENFGENSFHNTYDDDDDDDDNRYAEDQFTARAGDLMSSLPPEMRAENLMCYIGHEGTYTPAHREMCASLGQNIMVDVSGSDNGEKPGSSIWFMTETKDREVVNEYFLSMLGHDVDIEKHFAQINAWKKATFPVYIVEQKLGDLILVPPLAPHQVWNRGTRTMKVAWNRTTVETLEMALHEALPKARIVCRDEQYKNKAIVYYTLKKYGAALEQANTDRQLSTFGIGQDQQLRTHARTAQVADDFKRLLQLYTEILVDEMFRTKEKNIEYIPFDSNITCSYCRANIFNRFLTCSHCVRPLVDGEQDTYDVCMECYAMGRSCMCVSRLDWCEQWPWEELVDNYDRWRAIVISNDGCIDALTSPPPLEIARLRTGKKPVAQICQEQLRRRPFRDITKPPEKEVLEPSEPEVNDEGRVVRKKKRARKKGDVYRCHVCCHKDHRYRLAFCTTPGCVEAYCYGVLYRGFDLMPQFVMQQEDWKCPKCLKICNCGQCRRIGNTTPYLPKSTLLGHDTRPIADDRSVESLINFRLHNLMWLRNSGEEGRSMVSKRMQRLRQEADAAKAQQQSEAMKDVAEIAGSGFSSMRPTGPLADNNSGAAGVNAAAGDERMLAAGGSLDTYGRPMASALDAPLPSSEGPASYNGTVAPLSLQLQEGQANALPNDDDQVDSYPDPGMLHDEMTAIFGRAYYMDDSDSANRILFDPYQEPPPNSGVGNLASLETLPEFLEGYTRKPVRRPRSESLDPDYLGPKGHRRKHPKPAAEVDMNMNLDPALLAAAPTQLAAAPTATPTALPAAIHANAVELARAAVGGASLHAFINGPAANTSDDPGESSDDDADDEEDDDEDGSGRPVNKGGSLQFPANVPELRHARPVASYLVDIGSGDEAEDESTTSGIVSGRAPVAADAPAPRAPEPAATPVPDKQPTPTPARVTQTPSSGDEAFPEMRISALKKAAAAPPAATAESPVPRKRGRPRKSSGPIDTEEEQDGSARKGKDAEATTASARKQQPPPAKRSRMSEGGASSRAQDDTPRRPGRPPGRPRDQPPAAASTGRGPGRPPGRPPASKPAAESGSNSDDGSEDDGALPPPTTAFMSMAERMALRGKKFRMGRGGGRTGSSAAGVGSSRDEPSPVVTKTRLSSAAGRVATIARRTVPAPPQYKDVNKDEDGSASDEAPSTSSAEPSADERKTYYGRRGGTAARGGDRSRGRGQGRGRGRARGHGRGRGGRLVSVQ